VQKNIILSLVTWIYCFTKADLLTTDGTPYLQTIAGITEIVTAMEFLINNPEIKHGKIRVGFTPDEEIGRGHHFDVEKFGADWAYTMDGKPGGRTRV
jgi:tripeptide aminopeptidase